MAGFRATFVLMSSRRNPVSAVVAVILTAAVSLLGVRLFLPGTVTACAPAGSACCCESGASDSQGTPEPGGCGCTVSPATPVPVAALVAVEGVPTPALLALASDAAEAPVRVAPPTGAHPTPRARSAPTQALLETFRN
jgi:hypothetical protein